MVEERGLSALSQRSSLHVRSVASEFVARRSCLGMLGSGRPFGYWYDPGEIARCPPAPPSSMQTRNPMQHQ